MAAEEGLEVEEGGLEGEEGEEGTVGKGLWLEFRGEERKKGGEKVVD